MIERVLDIKTKLTIDAGLNQFQNIDKLQVYNMGKSLKLIDFIKTGTTNEYNDMCNLVYSKLS